MVEDASEALEVERIKARIESLVDQRFATGADTFYLSQLGNALGSDRLLLEKLTRRKLAEFIRSEFPFEIQVTGLHKNVLFIVRPGGTSPVPDVHKPRTTPRYVSRFWAAFVVPLPADERRFININSFFFGSDETAIRASGGDVREIRGEFIAPSDASANVSEISSRIDRWIEEEHLDRTRFIIQQRHNQSDTSPSVLDQLLEMLTIDQLKRVSLPLDVIRTLSERRDR
jgi:hypothetical protein